MSDARLRRLAREAATGDEDAAGRLLLERLRAGTLAAERLELLAVLGHAPARGALGQAAPAPAPLEAEALVAGLLPFGREVLVRASLVAARACLPLFEAEPGPCTTCGRAGQIQVVMRARAVWRDCPDCVACAECDGARRLVGGLPCEACVDLRPRRVVEAAEAWLDRGCPVCATEAAFPCPRHHMELSAAAALAAEAAVAAEPEGSANAAAWVVHAAVAGAVAGEEAAAFQAGEALRAAEGLLGPGADLGAAIRERLAVWALG